MNKWLKRAIIGKYPRRTLVRAAIIAVGCLVAFKFLVLPARVMSGSMEPRYRKGSIHFVNLLIYRFDVPHRGDIVAIRMAGKSVLLLKRVVGLPEERIAIRSGRLILDGRTFPEPYVRGDCDWNLDEVRIGPDEYFVVGDNRQMPIDAHLFGRVKRNRIIGRVLF